MDYLKKLLRNTLKSNSGRNLAIPWVKVRFEDYVAGVMWTIWKGLVAFNKRMVVYRRTIL
jgi:hypothetical protein